MNELIGKTILGLYVADDNEALCFATSEGIFWYPVMGDCCSTSWFNDVVGVSALIGATVTAVESVDLPDPADEPGRECLQAYGIKLKTSKGYVDIVFRNESNGFYGGFLCPAMWMKRVPQGCRQIDDDWTA